MMPTGLKIKDVADASGFSANTLRYYEQIGVLPALERTAAGYRIYDARILERLAFIARAKQLGCTLEEITGLTTAWDGGQCGPIQDQLRQLVADKIGAAQRQLAELMMFTSELQHAATALERHRPEGPCDTECGCVIACTLSAGSMKGRLDDWQALLSHVERREPIDDGVRLVVAPSVLTDDLVRLVAAEHDCCQFFRFAIIVDTRGVALEVRAPHDAQLIVDSMFGAAT
jgi:MerR family transcriptional regulator, copper efflux regulator